MSLWIFKITKGSKLRLGTIGQPPNTKTEKETFKYLHWMQENYKWIQDDYFFNNYFL